jgi:hypothetical protein
MPIVHDAKALTESGQRANMKKTTKTDSDQARRCKAEGMPILAMRIISLLSKGKWQRLLFGATGSPRL